MNIITSVKSFKNRARFMPDILNISHKHAKIFEESLQDSCTISGKNLTKSCKKLGKIHMLDILSILALTTLHDLAKSCKKLGKIHMLHILSILALTTSHDLTKSCKKLCKIHMLHILSILALTTWHYLAKSYKKLGKIMYALILPRCFAM